MTKSGQVFEAKSAGHAGIYGRRYPYVVKEVSYVPELQCNIFSPDRRLRDSGMTVKIASGKVSIEKDNRVLSMF